MAEEGSRLSAAARRTLDAAEAAVVRAGQLEDEIAQGTTTRDEVERRTRRAVARTGAVGSPQRNATINEEAKALRGVTKASNEATAASEKRARALQLEATAQREANREAQRAAANQRLAYGAGTGGITAARVSGIGPYAAAAGDRDAATRVARIQSLAGDRSGISAVRNELRQTEPLLNRVTRNIGVLSRFGAVPGQGVIQRVLGDLNPQQMQQYIDKLARVEQYREKFQQQPVGPSSPIGAGAARGPFVAGAGGILPPGGTGSVAAAAGGGGGRPPGGYALSPDLGGRLNAARSEAAAFRGELSRLTQQQGLASQAMRKHGALTTEFISAAARGEVTIRELGFQTTATIGKFGGWLGAGALVYGALGAVTALGRGAIDAYSGVNQLSRVITHDLDASKARASFRGLAQEFNLPIGDVTEAAYQMGKVFHDQNDAMEAARTVLFSVKVGELDVATATRYLTAITNGYNLEIERTAIFSDQVNQAQNKYGITVANVEAGVAKAAGTFKAAGGGLNELLALVTTAQKVTGVTGETAGTALARAPNFLRQEANKRALETFGINAQAPIDDIIEQAMKKARNLGGEQVQELAAAIFGPQYGARIGTPLLEQGELYNKVLKDTSPEKAKGSAQRELNRQLKSIEEQLKRVGVSFERLGANLAEAGAFDAIGGIVLLLNEALDGANNLLEAFNQLPDGLKTALIYGAQLALLFRTMRRLQLGESIAGAGGIANATGARRGAAEFFSEGDRGAARRIRSGLFIEKQTLEDRIARDTSAAVRSAAIANREGEALAAQIRKTEQIARQYGPSHEMTLASEADLQAARQVASARRATVAATELGTTYDKERLDEVNRQLDQSRRRFGLPGLNVSGTLAATSAGARPDAIGEYFPGRFERPTTSEPDTRAALENADKATARVQEEQRRTNRGFTSLFRRQADVATSTEDSARASEAVIQRGQVAVNRSRTIMGKIGAGFSRVLGSFGNLLFAGFALSLIVDQLKQMDAQADAEFAKAQAGAASAQQERRARIAAQEQASKGTTFAEGVVDPQAGFDELLGVDADPNSREGIRKAVAEQRLAQFRIYDKARAEAARTGAPEPFRYAADINKDVDRTREQLAKGAITRKQAEKALRRYDAELARSLDSLGLAGERDAEGNITAESQKASEKAIRDTERALKDARVNSSSTRDLADRITGLSTEDLNARLEAELALAGVGPRQGQHFDRARTIYEQISKTLSGSTDPADITALVQARQSYLDSVTDTINTELENALKLARTPQDRRAAYNEAEQKYRQQLVNKPKQDLEAARARVDRMEAEQRTQTQALDLPRGIGVSGANQKNRLADQVEEIHNKLKAGRGDIEALADDLREAKERFRQVQTELEHQRYEAEQATRDARFAARQAGNADTLANAVATVRHTGNELRRVIDEYGRGTDEFYQALAESRSAVQEEVKARLAVQQARARLASAGLTDPAAQAQAQIQQARQTLAFMQAHPNAFSGDEIINQEAEVREQMAALQEQAATDAAELAKAALAVKQARAEARGDAVASARYQLQQAQVDLHAADTPLERLQAQADVIQNRASVRDARLQVREDDIQYEADIGRLTLAQQISAYQRLLRTEQLTRDARRDLKRKIYQLQQDSESESSGFDLRVGNIKLPTYYEIRKAMEGGVNTKAGVVVNNKNEYNFSGGSTDEVMSKLAARERDASRRNTNKARSAGIR